MHTSVSCARTGFGFPLPMVQYYKLNVEILLRIFEQIENLSGCIITGSQSRGDIMIKNSEYIVETETTLLPFLLACLSNKSRNYAKGVLKRGQIIVDGKVCTDYACTLKAGQRVEITQGQPQSDYKMSIPVIYEDDDLLVIDKPAGMLSVATDTEKEKTAYHIATEYVKSFRKTARLFIVHRLDRETSGVLLFAKSEKIKLVLQENWEENALRRGYIAVVEGDVKPPEGRISSWLKQTKTLLVYSGVREGDGKLAVTDYKVTRSNESYSTLEISLQTGRKNQIRVHMKDLGFPVAGDKKYGAKTDPIKRLALHAHILEIKHPTAGEAVTFQAKPPKSFVKPYTKLPNE